MSNDQEAQRTDQSDAKQRQRVRRSGLAAPEEELAKAQLATHIERAIKRRRLTRAKAAALMGIG